MTDTFAFLRRGLIKGLAAIAVGTAAIGSLAHAEDKPAVLRIGTTAPGHLKFILARHNGDFEKEFAKDGIKVELVAFTNGGGEALTALATGAIEVTYTGNNPALRAAAKGADVHAIGLSSFTRNSSTTIIVAKDSPIRTLEDLKGKKVAYLPGTVRHSVFSKALKLVNLTTDDVESLNLDFAASGPALIRGDIDAIVESDSSTSKLIESGEARLILDSNKYPEWSAPYIISVNGEFLRKYPDIVKRLLKVDIQLARWADAHPEETVKIFVDETKTSEKSVRETYAGGKFFQDPKITPEAIQALKEEEAFMKEAKLLKGAVNYDTWIDTTQLDAAYKEVDANQ